MPKPEQRESDQSTPAELSAGFDRSLSADRRLVKSKLFAETFAQQKRWVGRYMVYWRRSGADASLRLGVITSKKVSLRANKRNRARRRLREAYRNCRPYLSGAFDVQLIGRRTILEAEWKDILRELLNLAERAEMLSSENRQRAEAEFGLKSQ